MEKHFCEMLARYQQEEKRLYALPRPTLEEGGQCRAYGMIVYHMQFEAQAQWAKRAREGIASQPDWLWHHDAWGRPYTDMKKAHDLALEIWAQEVEIAE